MVILNGIICGFISLIQLCAASNKELKYVQVLWRHGDRAPTPGSTIGEHPNEETEWPEGYGQLTTRGASQAFGLGRFLRERYDGFINKTYKPNEIHVRSDNFNRTLMTASSVMAGLYYPPVDGQIFEPDLPWFPVPVHTIELLQDHVVYMVANCPTADTIDNEIKNSSQVLKIQQENQPFFDFLENKTGIPIPDPVHGLHAVADGFACQHAHPKTHPLPSWANETVYQKLMRLYDLSWNYYFPTSAIQRLRGGIMLGEMVNRFMSVVEAEKNDTSEAFRASKIFAYSGHDDTIAGLTENMGAFNGKAPPYASAIMLEMVKTGGEYHVELYYRNDTQHEPYQLEIANCSSPCTLEAFVERSKPHMPPDWYKECGLPDPDYNPTYAPSTERPPLHRKYQDPLPYWISIGILGGIIFVLSFVVLCLMVRIRKIKHN